MWLSTYFVLKEEAEKQEAKSIELNLKEELRIKAEKLDQLERENKVFETNS